MSDSIGTPVLTALPAALLDAGQGFRSDRRFNPATGAELEATAHLPELAEDEPEAEPEDPLHSAWAEGYAEGAAQARAEAEALAAREAAARQALSLSLTRLDAEMAENLRRRLRETVAALCEEALRPLALDHQALAARVERAVSLLARADDERTIRLHPDDIAVLDPALLDAWHVLADPALERGAVRVETASGGIEDGPGQWRRAIAEALHEC